MRAEIISVGTELLLGHTINTDAAHVGRALSALGMDLLQVHTVGDNAGRLEAALREALNCADVVITTGGLGPTDDDMTKETVARVLGAPLEEHKDSLRRLREYFGSRPIAANQLKQAWLPRGSTAFPNRAGTAPGCAVPGKPGQWVILLPGPPSELLPMLEDSVMPFLQRMGGAVIASFMVRTFGIGEGSAALRIADLTEGANPTVAPYASDAEMFVQRPKMLKLPRPWQSRLWMLCAAVWATWFMALMCPASKPWWLSNCVNTGEVSLSRNPARAACWRSA